MLKRLLIANKPQTVKWTPADVCELLRCGFIRAEQLIQPTKNNTHKLSRDLFLLACQASLSSGRSISKEAEILRSYAKSINQISKEYDHLFRREAVSNETYSVKEEKTSSINSIDRLQARLFYLITQYSSNPCTHIATHIVQQLTSLCQHPNIELMPAQHYIYSQSINYWRSRLLKNVDQKNQKILH